MKNLEKTLSQMGNYFSSNEFSEQARDNGVSERQIKNGAIATFLHENAVQCETRRMWRKKTINKSEYRITEAIELLKSHGYKVLKPVSEWVEL